MSAIEIQYRWLGVYLEVTSECNLSCPYCYNDSGVHSPLYLDLMHVDRLFRDMALLGMKTVSLSGGEPLCHPNIKDIIQIASEHALGTTLITNSMLLDEDLVNFCSLYNVTYQVTLDGPTANIHDSTRTKGNFEALRKAVLLFNKYSLLDQVIFRVNIHKQNMNYLEEIAAIVKEFGGRYIDFAFVVCMGRGEKFYRKFSVYDNYIQVSDIISRISNIENKYKNNIKIRHTEVRDSFGCPFYSKSSITMNPRIDARGNIYPCQLFDDKQFSLGNITEIHLVDIVENGAMTRFLRTIDDMRYKDNSCEECVVKRICRGGCVADLLYGHIRQNRVDMCKIKKTRLKEYMQKAIQVIRSETNLS